MVEVAEQEGKLIPGKSVVIEPTSGNTGAPVVVRSVARSLLSPCAKLQELVWQWLVQ